MSHKRPSTKSEQSNTKARPKNSYDPLPKGSSAPISTAQVALSAEATDKTQKTRGGLEERISKKKRDKLDLTPS